jgi:hypothetical protein
MLNVSMTTLHIFCQNWTIKFEFEFPALFCKIIEPYLYFLSAF